MEALLTSLVLTVLLLPPAIWVLKSIRALDSPNVRSSHTLPTPRGAGMALVIGAVLAGSLSTTGPQSQQLLVFACFALAMGLLGLVDDLRRGLPVAARLLAAVIVTAVALPLLGGELPAGTVAGTILGAAWVVGFTNAFNFMDGINGISGLNGAVIAGVLWRLAPDDSAAGVVAAVTCGACLGFLPFNAPRAMAFLGDAGSYAIGGSLGLLAVATVSDGSSILLVALPFLPYLADTSLTLARRIARRERFYDAHRQHAYQRLVDRGWPHIGASTLVATTTALCALLAAAAAGGGLVGRLLALAGGLTLSVLYAASPNVLAWRQDRLAGSGTRRRLA